MSADELLTEADEAVLEASQHHENGQQHQSGDELVERVEELEEIVQKQREQMKTIFSKLAKIEDNGEVPEYVANLTKIEKYSKMVENGEEDLVGPTQRRAVAIFDHWWDISRRAGNGNYIVSTRRSSTKKNNPSQMKLDLEKVTGEDLAWEQVYRALRELAKLSGHEEDVETRTDQYGRMTIDGGAFRYSDQTTPDGKETYKLVELVDQNSLTVL